MLDDDQFLPAQTILDRILIKKIQEVPTEDGFEVPEKFRQSENWGEVLLIGDCVVLGGQKYPMTDFVNIGDRVKYGEYSAEIFEVARPDIYIIRVQDVRAIRRKING